MSDQPGAESISDDLTTYSVDDEDQLQPEDTLIGDEDPVEEGYTTPDRLHGSTAFGVTAEEQAREETIDQRVMQERPDPQSAYGAPDNEGGLDQPARAGGEDPDSIPQEQDYLGAEGDEVGRLVAPDEGAHPDTEKDVVAHEEDQVGSDSAEEAAMHYSDAEADAERP